MKKSRIDSLDALKAISIILVVFCHSVLLSKATLLGNFVMSLAWAAVPCFMMVSGAVMHQSKSFSWKKYFGKLAKTYVVLSAWRLIYLLVQALLTELNYSAVEVFQYLFLLVDLEYVNTGVMWYMIAYFIVLLVYPVTYYLFQTKDGRKALALMGVTAGISGILIPSGNWLLREIASFTKLRTISLSGLNQAMPMTNYGNMIFYFILGGFLYEYRGQVAKKLNGKRFLSITAIVIGSAGLMAVKYLDTGTWRWDNIYLSGGYQHLFTLVISLGMFLFFECYHLDRIYHFLGVSIGQFTMGIYYIHFILLIVCKACLYPMLLDYYSFSLNCAKTVIITCVCALLTFLLRKVPVIKFLVK